MLLNARREEEGARAQTTSVSGDVTGDYWGSRELGGADGAPYNGFPVGVATSDRRRAVVARQDLAAGDLAWSTVPWAAVVADTFVPSVCAACFRTLDTTSPPPASCEECGLVVYCSTACCDAARPLHSYECKAGWQAVQMAAKGRADSTAVRLLVQILAKRRFEEALKAVAAAEGPGGEEEKKSSGLSGSMQTWERAKFGDYIMALQAHVGEFPAARLHGMQSIVQGLSSLFPNYDDNATVAAHTQSGRKSEPTTPITTTPALRALDKATLLQLIGAVQCNSQGIVCVEDLDHHRRGSACSATMAAENLATGTQSAVTGSSSTMGGGDHKRGECLFAPYDFNHSCMPNTFVTFHAGVTGAAAAAGSKGGAAAQKHIVVQFRAIRPISRGEELTITYTDLYLPRPARQDKLLGSHCFQCAHFNK